MHHSVIKLHLLLLEQQICSKNSKYGFCICNVNLTNIISTPKKHHVSKPNVTHLALIDIKSKTHGLTV